MDLVISALFFSKYFLGSVGTVGAVELTNTLVTADVAELMDTVQILGFVVVFVNNHTR